MVPLMGACNEGAYRWGACAIRHFFSFSFLISLPPPANACAQEVSGAECASSPGGLMSSHTYVQALNTGFGRLSIHAKNILPTRDDKTARKEVHASDLGELSGDQLNDILARLTKGLPVYTQTGVLACLLLQLYLFERCE